jgi:hypothetical protein
LPRLGDCGRQRQAKQSSPRHWKFSKAHTVSRFAHVFQTSVIYDYITKLCKQQAEVIQNHENANVRKIGQGEARHRKYKKLRFDGGQVYDRLSAVVA